MTVWLDASFAVEWLQGTGRAAAVGIANDDLASLPAQYAEVLAFFGRRMTDLTPVVEQLAAVDLRLSSRIHLQEAARLYLAARAGGSKASLADAILAATADGPVASFDLVPRHSRDD